MSSNGQQDTAQANRLHDGPRESKGSGQDPKSQTGAAVQQERRPAGEAGGRAAPRSASEGADLTDGTSAGGGASPRLAALALAETQHRLAMDAAERFSAIRQTATETVRDATESLRTLLVPPPASHAGREELRNSLMGLFEASVHMGTRASEQLFQLYNPVALIESQQRFFREYTGQALEIATTMLLATRVTVDEALRPIEQQIELRRQARNAKGGN